MTGILEQMQATIGTLMNDVVVLKQQIAQLQQPVPAQTPPQSQFNQFAPPVQQFIQPAPTPQPQQQFVQQQPAPTPQPQQQFVQQQPAPTPQQEITSQTILDLIEPYLHDDNNKKAFLAQLTQMGIAALKDVQPHQYSEVYQRFSSVAAAIRNQTSPPASII
jgi:hypothetical protein